MVQLKTPFLPRAMFHSGSAKWREGTDVEEGVKVEKMEKKWRAGPLWRRGWLKRRRPKWSRRPKRRREWREEGSGDGRSWSGGKNQSGEGGGQSGGEDQIRREKDGAKVIIVTRGTFRQQGEKVCSRILAQMSSRVWMKGQQYTQHSSVLVFSAPKTQLILVICCSWQSALNDIRREFINKWQLWKPFEESDQLKLAQSQRRTCNLYRSSRPSKHPLYKMQGNLCQHLFYLTN